MSDDDSGAESLSSREREAFRSLPREAAPPPGLEDRVLGELRARGLVRAPRAAWRAVAAAAAIALAFAAGHLSARAPNAAPTPDGERWLLLLHEGDAPDAGDAEARFVALREWTRSTRRAGVTIDGAPLASGGEWLGGASEPGAATGFFLIEGVDAARARALARDCPFLDAGGRIELRRIARR